MDTHDQTTQQPVDEDLWGNTSNSRNNNEDRNASIQAYQRATIDLIAWWRLAVLQSKRRDLHQKWLYRETNEQSLSPIVSFSLDIHRFVIYHAIESSLTDGSRDFDDESQSACYCILLTGTEFIHSGFLFLWRFVLQSNKKKNRCTAENNKIVKIFAYKSFTCFKVGLLSRDMSLILLYCISLQNKKKDEY